MNLTRILSPIDFSDTSSHAFDLAVTVAGYYRSRVTALHVVTPLTFAVGGLDTSTPEVIELDRRRLQVLQACDTAKARQIGVDVLVDIGRPPAVILERAASLPADLIVMGTHGTSGFEHLMLGSVTERVLRHAGCPVLTVPPRAHATSQLPFKRLLCALDFSDVSLCAVHWALSLAQESGAQLTLMHVLEWPWDEPPAPVIAELPAAQGAALAEFRRYLEVTARNRLESLVPDSLPTSQAKTRVESGKAYVQILSVAAQEQSDLIVVGVRGRNPLDLTLFGSTANQLVRRATCAVLTMR